MSKQKISYKDAVNEIEEILKQIENGELDVMYSQKKSEGHFAYKKSAIKT